MREAVEQICCRHDMLANVGEIGQYMLLKKGDLGRTQHTKPGRVIPMPKYAAFTSTGSQQQHQCAIFVVLFALHDGKDIAQWAYHALQTVLSRECFAHVLPRQMLHLQKREKRLLLHWRERWFPVVAGDIERPCPLTS